MARDRSGRPDWAALLAAARAGDERALGAILEACRPYLLRVANATLGRELKGKVGGSDLVQETCLDAHRDFAAFTGRTEADLRRWLRGILVHNVAEARRHYGGTAKRSVDREVSLADGPDAPGSLADLIDPGQTPGALAEDRERRAGVERALESLSEADRQLLSWRYRDHLSFEEIGRRQGVSRESARRAWFRSLEILKRALEGNHAP
jgi:RNA polymerase sigma-70 factor (ECF subfamily)